jgi:RES domain-containing protein
MPILLRHSVIFSSVISGASARHRNLSGEGGRLYPARWNSGGEPMVYLAASPPGALVEMLVHLELERSEMPLSDTLLRVAVAEGLDIPSLRMPAGEAWKTDETLTQSLGDAWLKSQATALARVPSAILPETFNYLLNPLHPDARRVKIAKVYDAVLNARLIR